MTELTPLIAWLIIGALIVFCSTIIAIVGILRNS